MEFSMVGIVEIPKKSLKFFRCLIVLKDLLVRVLYIRFCHVVLCFHIPGAIFAQGRPKQNRAKGALCVDAVPQLTDIKGENPLEWRAHRKVSEAGKT